jgi:Flp pilus assembly protein TadD
MKKTAQFRYNQKGKHNKAISDFNTAIEGDPRDALAYNLRGVTYANKGQYDIACSDWKRACELGACKAYEWAKRKDVCQ